MNAQRLWPFVGRSILIVEDEPLIALDVHAALSTVGASVIAATDLRMQKSWRSRQKSLLLSLTSTSAVQTAQRCAKCCRAEEYHSCSSPDTRTLRSCNAGHKFPFSRSGSARPACGCRR
jgi:hypothetical protein